MDLSKVCGNNIPIEVVEWCEKNASNTAYRFCSYLEYIKGEVVERSFGCRRYKKYGVKITEVLRSATGEKSAVITKNLIYASMGGYIPVWEAEDRYAGAGWHYKVFGKEDFDKWEKAEAYVGFSKVYVNASMIFDIPEFKYCGYSGGGVISYLNAYRKDKTVEYFGKMGLSLSPVLIKKAKSDSKFRRFLFDNHAAISIYGVQAGLFAYKHGISVEEARRACYVKNQLDRLVAHRIPEIKGTTLDRQRVLNYVDTNDINYASYNDYLKAIKALKLDLNNTKNVFPNDFDRMHELRTAEYASKQAKIDAKKRKKLYKAFEKRSKELKSFEMSGATYTMIIPNSITELIQEGELLSHCVGKMGYDKKVADGVSIIAFLRKSNDLDTPYATVEYRLDKNELRQCYGYKDSKPCEEAIMFANLWAEMVTKVRIGE